MTIRTVTLSPGFDHDVHVDRIDSGEIGSILRWTSYAGGKGLNVSRIVKSLGGETVAYALIGAKDQATFTALAARDEYELISVPIDQSTRNNLTLRVDSGGAKSGHAVGRRFSNVPEVAITELFDLLLHDVSAGDLVSFNGSLPDGFRTTAWAEVAGPICEKGAVLVADVQGQAMLDLLATGLVRAAKPNLDESGALVGPAGHRPVMGTAVSAVRQMRALHVRDPIVTLGPLGAVHFDDELVVRSECPADNPLVEVGAGDAFVAGYCAAVDAAIWKGHSAIALGLATASAHVDGCQGETLKSEAERRLSRTVTSCLEPLG